jgi:hypothetical protein
MEGIRPAHIRYKGLYDSLIYTPVLWYVQATGVYSVWAKANENLCCLSYPVTRSSPYTKRIL